LLLPEQFVEWNHHGVYSDLLAFETDLAHLTAAVIIFVESPGAIAELGSFSGIPALAKKLITVLRAEHYANNSFIRWGPVKFLEDRYPGTVFVYAWTSGNTEVDGDLPNFIGELRAFINKPSKTETFAAVDPKHALLLIADLVDLFVVVQKSELKEWLLKCFQISLDDRKLKQYLYLLSKIGLIVEVPYGNNRFFAAPKSAVPYIEYGTKVSQFQQERRRAKARVVAYFERTDKPRLSALKAALSKKTEGAA
jgi:hypothetical protein